jgi:glycosyltransferase involved in cell wall biosynthesis
MVSIILPTYNRAAYLRDSIGSVLRQPDVDLELFVIDDGSTDNTGSVVSSFADDRIKYYKRPHTGRLSAMKNFAIDKAKGEFLAFMDSDDLWTPGKLKKQLQLLKENPGLGFSLTDITVFRGDAIIKEFTYHTRGAIQQADIFPWITQNGFLVYNPTLLLRKTCLEHTGYFNEDLRSGCLMFNMRLAYHYRCGVFFEPMLLRRLHDSNISDEKRFHNYDEYLFAYESLYKEGKIKKRRLQKARGNAFYKLGELYKAEHRLPEARRHYRKALHNDPLHRGACKALLQSYLPWK